MRKVITAISLALIASIASAQSSLGPAALWSRNEPARIGVALNVDARAIPVPVSVLFLVNSRNVDTLYIGAGLNLPVYTTSNGSINAMVGWSANFNKLTDPRRQAWGIGLNATFRL